MKHETLYEALEEIQPRHIAEAANYKKKSPVRWIAPVAAVLAVAILAGAIMHALKPASTALYLYTNPTTTEPQQTDPTRPTEPQIFIPPVGQPSPYQQLACFVAGAQYPIMTKNYALAGGGSYSDWHYDQMALHTQPEGYADSLQKFWAQLDQALLSGSNGNVTCSPVNIYMALAMLAEITDGQSRQQILNALGADSIEQLRTQAKQVWQAHYNNDQLSTSILANSLWLQENYGFDMDTAQFLAENYYASVFQGDLGSQEMNDALKTWLNQETGGLLEEQIQNVSMDPATVLGLASTIYYQVQWSYDFKEENNTEGIFHGANGDTTEVFMNKHLGYGTYYWSEHFGATFLSLEDGSRMWLFLPDEGYSPQDITQEVHAFLQTNPLQSGSGYQNKKDMRINLSLPKFDISAELDLRDVLESMGITDIFDVSSANFTPILPEDDEGYVNEVKHAARVAIDEKGVTAAAFTLILRAGAAMPPEDEMDFTLDRPFLFVVESEDGLPLFTGTVMEP